MSLAPPDLPPPGAMTPRVTQTDVARAAGVHNTTVSLALRNSPAIPEGTRKRIQALAEEMGYHPDPALRALVAYRKGCAVRDRKETLAYITNAETRWGWRELPADELFYAGAMKKAAQHGYQLEHFWLGEPGLTQRRLSSMLFHRGITGALLASHRPAGDTLLEFDWRRMGAVKIGFFPQVPALHRVTDDHQGSVRLAMKRIFAAGYRRVGLVLPKAWDESVDQAWSSGFMFEQNRAPANCRLPVLFLPARPAADLSSGEPPVDEARTKALARWLEVYRPDAILSSFAFLGGALEELGISIPRDLAFVDLFLSSCDGRLAGVRQSSERVGEIATEMLVGLLQQNICGEPAVTTATLVEGVWCDGASLPPARRKRDWPGGSLTNQNELSGQLEPVAY